LIRLLLQVGSYVHVTLNFLENRKFFVCLDLAVLKEFGQNPEIHVRKYIMNGDPPVPGTLNTNFLNSFFFRLSTPREFATAAADATHPGINAIYTQREPGLDLPPTQVRFTHTVRYGIFTFHS
jgi:hypothetical protein